jgi:uncharacterized protein involved in exopolysaccharide biosynthesis
MDIKQMLTVIWRQRMIVACVLAVGVVVFLVAVKKSHSFAATAQILVVGGSQQTKESAALDPSKDPTESAIALADVPSLLTSTAVLSEVGRQLDLTPAQVLALGKSIKAKPSLSSSVLPVTVTDKDPKRAVAETNAVVHELQRYEQHIAESRYDLFVQDLQKQLSDRRLALAKIDHGVDELTTRDPYVTYTAGTEAISTRLVALKAQRDTLAATVVGDASAASLAAQRPQLARALASQEIIAKDPIFDNLHDQYGKDLASFNKQSASYTDKFPGMKGLRDQVGREAQGLAQTEKIATANPAKSKSYVDATLEQNHADATLANDRAQLAAVERQIDDMQSHLESSRVENVSLASLRRDREAGNAAYARLADRLAVAEADRAQAASINTIVLLDEATTAAPTLTSRPPVIAVAVGAIFLWIAITLAFIMDGIDARIRTRTTIEELYGTPVFGSVG